MADDLSARAAGPMWPTGQGTDMTSDPDRVMTAPGSVPAVPGTDDWTHPDVPAVVPDHFAATNREDGGEPHAGARWETVNEQAWGP
jgi:hypothetical protein